MGGRIQLQQRNCSRFTRDFSRRSTFLSSQRTRSTGYQLTLRYSSFYFNHQWISLPDRLNAPARRAVAEIFGHKRPAMILPHRAT
jgi:hypothetical protein